MKTCFLTGATRGVGLELARQLSKKGFEVIVGVRKSSKELEKISNVIVLEGLDYEDPQAIEKFFKKNKMPKLDLVILNAGAFIVSRFPELDFALLEKQMRINATAPLYITQHLLPFFKEGTKLGLLSSLMASMTDNVKGGSYPYRMSKAALNAAGKSLSIDLKDQGVIVTLLHPGYVKTQMTDFKGKVMPDEAAAGILEVLEKSTLETTGQFVNYKGELLPW